MTIGVLIVSHGPLGEVMLDVAIKSIHACPVATRTLSVPLDANPEILYQQAQHLVKELDDGDGVLILTDIYGATPSNIANRLSTEENTLVVSGLNLAMLLRVFNYPQLKLSHLAEKAVDGGQQGIRISSGKIGGKHD
jgi:PTS system ascorbate-specific IIA component